MNIAVIGNSEKNQGKLVYTKQILEKMLERFVDLLNLQISTFLHPN